jgi:nuclear pore complex protein Nup155
MPSAPSSMTRTRQAVNLEQAKYLKLLAHYYVYKRKHVLATHVLLRLSERRKVEGGEMLTLEQG